MAACCVVRVVGWDACHAPLRVHRCCSFVEQWQLCDGCARDGRTIVAVCVVADMQRCNVHCRSKLYAFAFRYKSLVTQPNLAALFASAAQVGIIRGIGKQYGAKQELL